MTPDASADRRRVKSVAVVASSNASFRSSLARSLGPPAGILREARGGAEALAMLEDTTCGTLVLDHWLPDLEVSEVVQLVKCRHPDVHVMVVDPRSTPPLDSGDDRASGPPGESSAFSTFPCREEPLPGMVGRSEPMQRVYRLARLVAPRPTPVLITGETGTGKELVARAIHTLSPRSKQRFVVVNCAAIPDTLLEAKLFGYVRGAFTGAFQSCIGRINAAQGGTLLLDEISELPLSMQAKLLRFLQEGEVQPLGSDDVFRVDVRIVASTNADLAGRVREGRFREDLFYRLMVFPIELSPVRKRVEDIRPLAEHFLAALAQAAGSARKSLAFPSCSCLERHVWPGNVRELRHAVERAWILADEESEIRPEHLQFLVNARSVREVLAGPVSHGMENAIAA